MAWYTFWVMLLTLVALIYATICEALRTSGSEGRSYLGTQDGKLLGSTSSSIRCATYSNGETLPSESRKVSKLGGGVADVNM